MTDVGIAFRGGPFRQMDPVQVSSIYFLGESSSSRGPLVHQHGTARTPTGHGLEISSTYSTPGIHYPLLRSMPNLMWTRLSGNAELHHIESTHILFFLPLRRYVQESTAVTATERKPKPHPSYIARSLAIVPIGPRLYSRPREAC